MTTAWDTIMKPLADSPVWVELRRAAGDNLVRDLGPDSGFGISSSDINHTIFSAGKRALCHVVDPSAEVFPVVVLALLLDES